MVERKTPASMTFDFVNAAVLIFMMFLCFYPIYHVLVCSFSDSSQLVGQQGIMLLPKGFNMEAYKVVWKNPNIWTGYLNTIFIVLVGTALNLLMTSLGAYALSRRRFAIRRVLNIMIVITMYFSGGMIPTYLLVYKYLHLGDSIWALILPVAISAWNLIIMRTNFQAIPESIEESAKIDGANDFTILFRIVLPLSLPIIMVMMLFYGVQHWNSWFQAMLYLREKTKYPLQLVLREILLLNSLDSNMSGDTASIDKYTIGESIKYATIIVSTLPILCVYPFLQKYFVKGVMVGAVKG